VNRTKLGFFVLIFLVGATLLVPVLLTGIASASCGVCVADYDRCAVRDYERCAVRDYDRCAVRDYERCAVRDYDRCAVRDYDRCSVRDYDRCSVRDYERCAVRDCDRCDRCASVSEYRCDLYSCSWTRDYGCCNSR